MACSVWVLASVTDQGGKGTEGRERERDRKQGNKLFHRHANQTELPTVNASNSMTRNWDSGAELLDHTIFEMSG